MRDRRLHGAIACVTLLLATLSNPEAKAMGKVVLFSPLSGVVLDHGEPVAGALVKRHVHWIWGHRTRDDAITTDVDGRFAFAALEDTMLLGSLLPHEPRVEQRIAIEHGGRSHLAWSLDKRNYEANGELIHFDEARGLVPLRDPSRPMRITCRLEAAEHRNGKVHGICDFD